jgi:hypothetical protein
MNTRKLDPYGQFLDSYLKELIATPDAEILASEKELTVSDFGEKLLARATLKAARHRLSQARAGVEAQKQHWFRGLASATTPAAARALLAKYARDPRLTLAARNLDELSDEDAVRLSTQLAHLLGADEDDSGTRDT